MISLNEVVATEKGFLLGLTIDNDTGFRFGICGFGGSIIGICECESECVCEHLFLLLLLFLSSQLLCFFILLFRFIVLLFLLFAFVTFCLLRDDGGLSTHRS
eukprot:505384_1